MRPSSSREDAVRSSPAERYRRVREATERLVEPLDPEDCVVQSMPDVSPTKWHLAHATWFFETFVLETHVPGYRPAQPEYRFLFNSYYNSVGPQYSRPRRGLLTRPSMDSVRAYRRQVDAQMLRLLEDESRIADADLSALIELGLNHEQQHQELILMDIKHVLFCNPTFPAYRRRATWPRAVAASDLQWSSYAEGIEPQGYEGSGFAYDNERPPHRTLLQGFRLASRPMTNGEYLEFVEDGGYRRAELWLADGWTTLQQEDWKAPLYWVLRDDGWYEYSLAGLRPLDPDAPVCHVSYFEADAFAGWFGARLPGEAEWERVARDLPVQGNFVEDGLLLPRPSPSPSRPEPQQMFGDVWEWTRSPYAPYPGFRAEAGAVGEYNGKFMCNQFVLRGGSCVTPRSHVRATYRNFFYPHCRWQFGGVRLAGDL